MRSAVASRRRISEMVTEEVRRTETAAELRCLLVLGELRAQFGRGWRKEKRGPLLVALGPRWLGWIRCRIDAGR